MFQSTGTVKVVLMQGWMGVPTIVQSSKVVKEECVQGKVDMSSKCQSRETVNERRMRKPSFSLVDGSKGGNTHTYKHTHSFTREFQTRTEYLS